VDVGMIHEVLTPGMQNADSPYLTLFPISGSGGIGRNDIGIDEFLFDKDLVFGNIQQ
jgi:hypothetical protein